MSSISPYVYKHYQEKVEEPKQLTLIEWMQEQKIKRAAKILLLIKQDSQINGKLNARKMESRKPAYD